MRGLNFLWLALAVVISSWEDAHSFISLAHGEPKSECKCAPPGKKPLCKEKQKAFLVDIDQVCKCKKWSCLYISCDHIDFDPKKPNVKCDDCAFVPTKKDDCGCPKWECARRPCDKPENKPIEKCPSECDAVQSKEVCGCVEYKCKSIPPPKSGCTSNTRTKCDKCQHCVKRDWISGECKKKTGFVEEFCEKAPCPPPQVCGPCQIPRNATDSCDCPVIRCKEKSVEDQCGKSCGPCKECTLDKDIKCPKAGVKTCKKKPCPPPKECGPCQIAKTSKNACGCLVVECVDKVVKDQCKESCGPCQTCTLVPDEACPNAGVKTCQEKVCPTPKPVSCGKCEMPKTEKDQCNCATNVCRRKVCPQPKIAECGPCEKMKLTEDDCGCKKFECVREVPNPNPPSECTKKCEKCHTCKWAKNPECGNWEQVCERECPKVVLPKNLQCFEKVKVDDCGCDVVPNKKPCVAVPEGYCKPGFKECNTLDACNCQHQTCCPCTEFDPDSCTKCQRPHYTSTNGKCRSGTCVPRKCPPVLKKNCKACEEKKVERDDCGCAVERCVKKTCQAPVPCPSGLMTTKAKDQCGCVINNCGVCPPEKKCSKDVCHKECQECPKPKVPAGYKEGIVSGRAFKRHNQAKKTWKEARKACQAEGGDLVVDDNQAIRNWMNSQGSDLWIGASDEAREGHWVWVDGNAVTNPSWDRGQPDNGNGRQDCAVTNYMGRIGKWDDQYCDEGKHFWVCQFVIKA